MYKWLVSDLSLVETVSLGLLVAKKWDKALTKYGGSPTSEQIVEQDEFTPSDLLTFRSTGHQLLAQYLAQHKTEDRWSRGFWQGVAASFFYAAALALMAIAIKVLGSDVFTVLRFIFEKGP